MPLFLLLCLITACDMYAQPIILMDKECREPFSVVAPDSSSIDPRFFPVYRQDIDAVMELTAWYIKTLEENRINLNLSAIKVAGASKFIGQSSLKGSVTHFELNLVTRCGQSGYSMQLVNNKDGHKKRLQKLRAFYDYLRNNRFLVLPEKS